MTGESRTILSVVDVTKQFRKTSPVGTDSILTAVDSVQLNLAKGESLGIAGESGCGKSTLGKLMAGLIRPDSGNILYKGNDIYRLSRDGFRSYRRATQMVFQDPYSSLNPRMRIGDTVAEPFIIAGLSPEEACSSACRILETVGLTPDYYHRFPDEFSGGQRQRIGIARALAAAPEILIADEPVSSLDISIQAQIINLLLEMKSEYALSLVMISHNLSVLKHMCDHVAVMYLGAVVEQAPAAELFRRCRHPYTEALLAAIPSIEPGTGTSTAILTDDLPSPYAIPSGCRFHPRCRYAAEICAKEKPVLAEYGRGHFSACHFSAGIFPG